MAIVLNSVTFYPSDVQLERTKIGVTLVAASGARRFVHRLSGVTRIYKNVWDVSWQAVPVATRTAVLAVYAITSAFVFTDQYGGSHAVQCEAEGYTERVNFVAHNGDLYYDLSLKLWQE